MVLNGIPLTDFCKGTAMVVLEGGGEQALGDGAPRDQSA